MKIVTGKTNTPHISSADDGERNAALVGVGDYVLSAGKKFEYAIVSNNTIDIFDGELLMHGRHGRIEDGAKDTIAIENGAQGVKRIDLIVCEYAKRGEIESMTIKVIKGIPGTAPTEPAVTTGDIRKGTLLHQMPLYRVTLDGLTIVKVEALFKVIPSMQEALGNIVDLIYPVGAIYMSTANTNPEVFLGGKWQRWGAGKVPVGVDAADVDFQAADRTGGEKTHVLTVGELPAHGHSIQNHSHTLASHSHSNNHAHPIPALSGTTNSTGNHEHDVPHNSDASTGSKNARMMGYDASGKTNADYSNRYTGNAGAHAHTVTTKASTTGGNSTNTGGSGQLTTNQTGGNTNNTGGGAAHNNMPPYITCYMWKRTA